MADLVLEGQPLAVGDVIAVAREQRRVRLGNRAVERMIEARRLVAAIIGEGRTVYGINTGFGSLSCVRIPPEQTDALQRNLVRSHACGAGETLPEDTTRALMLLCAASLARGHSGVRPEIVAGL